MHRDDDRRLTDRRSESALTVKSTCQDLDNYDPAPKTLRFLPRVQGVPRTVSGYALLKSVDISPARIEPGRALGRRQSVAVTFYDAPHSDIGLDDYAMQRRDGTAQADGVGYKPEEIGTFWGKWRGRHIYHEGRALRHIHGVIPWDVNAANDEQPDFTEAQFFDALTTEHYLIDTTDGPTPQGEFRITAKDILKQSDDDKSQSPAGVRPGNCRRISPRSPPPRHWRRRVSVTTNTRPAARCVSAMS